MAMLFNIPTTLAHAVQAPAGSRLRAGPAR